ncbi:hypothetical protein V8E53_005764, partial [Lactarius tabidus]
MGLLFAENTSDDDFVPSSGMGKGKGKSRAITLDGVVHSPESVGASFSTRVQKKRRTKSFPDEAEHEHRDDDHENDEDGSRVHAISAPALDAQPEKRRRTTTSEMAFCHHCRLKTPGPKMRYTLIVASARERCRKLFCDGCTEKRTANCSLCAPKRGEQYVPEQNGGRRSWIAQQGGGSYRPVAVPRRAPTAATKIMTKTRVKVAPAPAKKRPPAITIPAATTNTQPLEMRSFPVSQPTVPPPPPAPPPATSSTDGPTQKPEQPQKQCHVFIGKPLKAWGRFVVLPDPKPDQPQKTTKGKGKVIARRGHKSKKTLFFRQNRRRRRQSASFDANADNPGDDDVEGGNLEEGDLDADADTDTDDGVWPGEFIVPTIVITEPEAEPEMEMVGTKITPEEVKGVIGAAFAIGAAAG